MKELFSIRTKCSYYKVFHRTSVSNRNEKKTKILTNKPVHLGLSIRQLNEILMNQFWYDYVKPKYCEIENIHKNR